MAHPQPLITYSKIPSHGRFPGVLRDTSTHKITVSARFVGRSQAAELLVTCLSVQGVSLPLKGFRLPNSGSLRDVARAGDLQFPARPT